MIKFGWIFAVNNSMIVISAGGPRVFRVAAYAGLADAPDIGLSEINMAPQARLSPHAREEKSPEVRASHALTGPYDTAIVTNTTGAQ